MTSPTVGNGETTDPRKLRIFVTGAGGFIGSRVSRILAARGHSVLGTTRAAVPRSVAAGEARLIRLDLADAASVRAALKKFRPDLAIHLAWYAVHGKFWTAPENIECVTWSLALACALAEAGCRRIVGVGSCAEYDWERDPLSETASPLHPRTLYGASKHALHMILERYCRQKGISLAWARLFFLFGPGEAPARLIPHVIASLLSGERARVSEGSQVRDFLHVEDAAQALSALSLSQAEGPVNVASGKAASVREIVSCLADIAGRPGAVDFGAIPSPADEPASLRADVGRLRSEVGWTPSRTLRAGLEETLRWWRERR